MLGLGGELDERGLKLFLPLLQGGASAWPMSVAPCRLEEDPAHVGVAALGDGTLVASLAARVLARDNATVRHQLGRPVESRKLPDLDGQGGRRQLRDPAQSLQPVDERAQ